jgi:hypothetical protein
MARRKRKKLASLARLANFLHPTAYPKTLASGKRPGFLMVRALVV